MINYLNGKIINCSASTITLLVNQIGFEIFVPKLLIFNTGQNITLFIYFNWNQENGPTLYGFITEKEKKVFELIISCSGIGPKIGLSVLAQMTPDEFVKFVNDQDVKSLSSINGIGIKKAEQIIVSLKHKVISLIESGIVLDNENYKFIKEINDVLNSLNYSKIEITNTLDYLRNNYSEKNYTFDQMLKQALSFLSKRV